MERGKAKLRENLGRSCIHVDGADAFENALQLAIGERLACIPNHDAAKAGKLLTIIDDWRNVECRFVTAAGSSR